MDVGFPATSIRAGALPALFLGDFHGVGVPLDDAAVFHAEVAEQGGSGGAEAEDGVLDYGFAGADRGEEVVEVVVAVAVALGARRTSRTPR